MPQGSVLGPDLYLLYTADLPIINETIVAMFADDTAILLPHNDYSTAVSNLQKAANYIHSRSLKWKMQISPSKSKRIDFSRTSQTYIPTTLNSLPIPYTSSVKYLGIHLDTKFNWNTHIKNKLDELRFKIRTMFWLFRRKTQLSLENKRRLYLSILQPI